MIAPGVAVPFIGWGTLTLSSPAGVVTCHTESAGYVEDPHGGGAGIGATQQFSTWGRAQTAGECKTVSGVEETRVVGTGLVGTRPTAMGASGSQWTSELVGAGVPFRYESVVGGAPGGLAEAAGLRLECCVGGALSDEEVFYGSLTPMLVGGFSAARPTMVEFGAGSGELQGGAMQATVSGDSRLLG